MEIHENLSVSLFLSDLTLLANVTSCVQCIQVYHHPSLGHVLVIDHEIHNVEQWAPLYHEAIVHIPMMFINCPQSVLILGGGDLYAAEIALKYPSVKKVVICDFDPEVINLTARYYPHAKGVLSDSRLSIIYQDAKVYLKTCQEQFDLIVDDCFNLVEDFSDDEQVFQLLYDKLTEETGVCSSLMYRHIFEKLTLKQTKEKLITKYKTVMSLIAVPEYPGVLHLLTMWGRSTFLSQDLSSSVNQWHKEMLKKKNSCGQFFSQEFCKYYLYLPQYIRKQLQGAMYNNV